MFKYLLTWLLSMDGYVLFIPQGGLNDCFARIWEVINYCKANNRIMLLDMTRSQYAFNFSYYFYIMNCECKIIYDTEMIKEILNTKKFSIHPVNLPCTPIELLTDRNIRLEYKPGSPYICNDIPLPLPENNVSEEIIIHSRCGGGDGFPFFINNVFINNTLKEICQEKIKILGDKYLCIQVRHTDIKCDYKSLYENHKDLIHSYKNVYICTDNITVVDYFRSKNVNVHCFTTFSDVIGFGIHHTRSISGDVKMRDLFVDIYIATKSNEFLSCSSGGFIQFLRHCISNKDNILSKFEKR